MVWLSVIVTGSLNAGPGTWVIAQWPTKRAEFCVVPIFTPYA